MENYDRLAKLDNNIMQTMKLTDIAHILAETNKGTLSLKLTKGGTGKDYQFVLDAVPYPEKENTVLLDLFKTHLFPLCEHDQALNNATFV